MRETPVSESSEALVSVVDDSDYKKSALFAAGADNYIHKRDIADDLYHAIVEAVPSRW